MKSPRPSLLLTCNILKPLFSSVNLFSWKALVSPGTPDWRACTQREFQMLVNIKTETKKFGLKKGPSLYLIFVHEFIELFRRKEVPNV